MTRLQIVLSTAAAIATLSLAACTFREADAARVDCGTPGPHGVDCEVRRTGGSGAFEACWELAIACQNGGGMRAPACHAMAADAQSGTQNMPVTSFSGQDSCDVPTSGQVEHLKVEMR